MRTFAIYVENDGAPKKRPRKMSLGNQQKTFSQDVVLKPTSHFDDTDASRALNNCNPLNRLCEKLLDWRILTDLAGTKMRLAGVPSAIVGGIPLVFKSYMEYVEVWEPLLIAEIKANILSSALSLSSGREVPVELHESSDSASSSSPSTLKCLSLTNASSDTVTALKLVFAINMLYVIF